jgi:glycosyltransferase involved in cell wall biosynthesis
VDRPPSRIALVHDWIITFGGAERVLIEMHRLFPTAPIYTLFHDPQGTPEELDDALIIPSVLNKFPSAIRRYQSLLPLYPYGIEQFDLREYDLVISLSHAAAKGVLTHSRQMHLCYCYTPMRYVWDLYQTYLKHTRLSRFRENVFRASAHYLRMWDWQAAQRVDRFIAISETVQRRIEKTYNRKSVVIHPPVNTRFFVPAGERADEYFLLVGRFVPYKGMELVVETFNDRAEPLLVVGDGPLRERLMKTAKNPRIEFLGSVTDEELRTLYQNAHAVIFPSEEDFGLIPCEAMACGTPVIAYERGGATETVISGVSGTFYREPAVEALDRAISRYYDTVWNREDVRAAALRFSTETFHDKMLDAVQHFL